MVTTLGTLHDLFLSNPNYGIKDFASALNQFQPDLILTEVLPERANAGDASIDGGIEQAVLYAYAQTRSIPIIATDWFDEAFILESIEESKKVTPDLIQTLTKMSEFRKSFETSSLLELNSEGIQDLVRDIYKVFEANGLMASKKRNLRIWENIEKELSRAPDRRVLIVYGMDHKFFIEDRLKRLPDIDFKQVSEWFSEFASKAFKLSSEMKEISLKNLETSEALLKQRLSSGHYSKELETKLKAKLPNFSRWTKAIESL